MSINTSLMDEEVKFPRATFYLMDCNEDPVYLMGDWTSNRKKRKRAAKLLRSEEPHQSFFERLKLAAMTVSTTSYWSLFLMGSIYAIGELGHFLLGTVSRSMAQDMKYGDQACLQISSVNGSSSDHCKDIEDEIQCNSITVSNSDQTIACIWDYNGLGLAYQILAGPAFIFMYAFAGLIWGYLADKFNRVYFLSLATIIFSLSIAGTAFSTQYWHVLLFRMALAFGEAGCSPLASGIIADLFPQSRRGLAMSLFNWGIYIGYGFSYAVGNYITDANIFDQGWRAAYVLSGLPGILIAITFFLTVREPKRTGDDEALDVKGGKNDSNGNAKSQTGSMDKGADLDKPEPEKVLCEGDGSNLTIISSDDDNLNGAKCNTCMEGMTITWEILRNPAMVFLALGACIRHSAGYTWGYNSALYFQTYYPDYDVTWWLTGISIAGGTVGTAMGGYLSDRLVNRLGISSRALVLAASQLIASPFALGLFFLDPPWALVSLLIGYVAAESWFGVMFAILVELVPSDVRSKSIAVALFIINNFGGNLPIIVDPVANLSSYRTAITIFYPGALITSSILFFICWIILRSKTKK